MLAKRRGPVGFEAATRPVACPEEALLDRLGVRQVLETRVPLGIRLYRLDSNVCGPTRVAQTNPADESESIDRTNHAQTIEPLRRTTVAIQCCFPYLQLRYAIAKRGEPPHDPGDRSLTWREHMILNKRPGSSGSEEEWLRWHEKYRDKIDTKYFTPERFDHP
jgi:hypothetical protein